MVNNLFRYNVSALYINGDEVTEIMPESISSLATVYDYDNKNMPILYMEFNVKADLYDAMVINIETARIILTIKRYDKKAASGLERIFIRKEFSYLMETDPDYHKPLEKLENSREPIETSYKRGIIALMDTESLDNNSVQYNDIFKNSNMISIVHRYTKHMRMIIEPFTYNETIPCLIIPPITSIRALLKFLNECYPFYDKGYRYFRDFDRTYLLSNEGNPVDDNTDMCDTMIIEIMDTTAVETKSSGIYTDPNQKAYVMQVDALDTNVSIDIVRNKEFNAIVGVDTFGDSETVDLFTNIDDQKEKVLLSRVYNLRYLENVKAQIDNGTVVLQLKRTEIDSSIITPNKEYIIKNYREYSEYNGRYILSSKRDVYLQQNNEFISNTILTFRKMLD